MADLDVLDQLARYGDALERAVSPVTVDDLTVETPAEVVPIDRRRRRRAVLVALAAVAALVAVVVGVAQSDESSQLDVREGPGAGEREGLGLDGLLAALPAPPEGTPWGVTFTDLELADELLGLTPPAPGPDPGDREALLDYQLALTGGPGADGTSPGVGATVDVVATETASVVVDPTVVGAVVRFDTLDEDAASAPSGVGTTLLGGSLDPAAVIGEVRRLEPDTAATIEETDGGTRVTLRAADGVRIVAHVGDEMTVLADDAAAVDAVLAAAAGDAPSFVDDPARAEIVERLAEAGVAAGTISDRTLDAREWAEQRAAAICTPADCDAAALDRTVDELEARATEVLVPPHEVWAIGGTISRDTATDQYPPGTPLVILLVTFDGPAPSLFDSVSPWIDGTADDDPAQDPAPAFDLVSTSEKGATSESSIVVEEPGRQQWSDLVFRVPLPLPSEGG